MPRIDDGNPPSREFNLDFEGHPVPAREGETVATALLASGERVFSRSAKYHRPRGPYCMSGACSHCLMRVDGVPNVHTCCTPAKPGQRVERQNAYPSAEHDVFGAIDWFFPKGLDHHAMFAGTPVAEQVMAKVARQLAGFGLLPEKLAPARQPAEILHHKVVVVGAGPAGLAAARELATAEIDFLLLERDGRVGGRLTIGAVGPKDPTVASFDGIPAASIRVRTTVIGLFTDEGGRFVAAISSTPAGARLVKVYAERFVLTTGVYPSMWPFENNEAPGVYAGRAVSRLIRQERFLPGERFTLLGTGPELYDLAQLIAGRGGQVVQIVDVHAQPPKACGFPAESGEALKALGRTQVRGFTWKDAKGHKRKVACDAIAVVVPGSPAFELARQAGAKIHFSEAHDGFVVDADGDGRTEAEGVFVAGDLLGGGTAAQAAESGTRAGRAVVGGLR